MRREFSKATSLPSSLSPSSSTSASALAASTAASSRLTRFILHLCFCVFACCFIDLIIDTVGVHGLTRSLESNVLVWRYDEADPKLHSFSADSVESYSRLLFVDGGDEPSVLIGARDYLARASTSDLRKLDEVSWPADAAKVDSCQMKGQSEEECHNFVRVLVAQNTTSDRIFTCGTNAFSPMCRWRNLRNLTDIMEEIEGAAKCPYSPQSNVTSLLSDTGALFTGSPMDFLSQDPAICRSATHRHSLRYETGRSLGPNTVLRTRQYNPIWLDEPNFVGSYEIGDFVYFFFRESAVETLNCGKAVYSRVARVCKHETGKKHYWTTYLKARLTCSIPGKVPFYYDELQDVEFDPESMTFYGVFTTAENALPGSALCSFTLTDIEKSFSGPFKYQPQMNSAWMPVAQTASVKDHFACRGSMNEAEIMESWKYQLLEKSVSPSSGRPVWKVDSRRATHLAVHRMSHLPRIVAFVALEKQEIWKIGIDSDSGKQGCALERVHPFPTDTGESINIMKSLSSTESLYLGTDKRVLRVPMQRCDSFDTKEECLGSRDAFCGWDTEHSVCSTRPDAAGMWEQELSECPKEDASADGGWSLWSTWSPCLQNYDWEHENGWNPAMYAQGKARGKACLCRTRECSNPAPKNGGVPCDGHTIEVTNCTVDGGWTPWSEWSQCSQSCGLAHKSRRRTCTNPPPAFGGAPCLGKDTQEAECQNPPCRANIAPGIWDEWGAWSNCSKPCGGGYQERKRVCEKPKIFGARGSDCFGCGVETRPCNEHQCPESKVVAATEWFDFNSTADGFFQIRYELSCQAIVDEPSKMRKGDIKVKERYCKADGVCVEDPRVDLKRDYWTEWTQWSDCSRLCGGGRQRRSRNCLLSGQELCYGPAEEERDCNVSPCRGDEGWSSWSDWSACGDDGEVKSRVRTCVDKTMAGMGPNGTNPACVGGQVEVLQCPGGVVKASTRTASATSTVGVGLFCLALGMFVGAAMLRVYDKWLAHKRRPACQRQVSASTTNSLPDFAWDLNGDVAEPNHYYTGAELINTRSLHRHHHYPHAHNGGHLHRIDSCNTGTMSTSAGDYSSIGNRNSSGSSTATYVRVPDREYETATIKRISFPANSFIRADLRSDEPFNT